MEEGIDVNFRLDENCRTVPSQSVEPTVASNIDYESKTISTSFASVDGDHLDIEHLLDELLLDCEIADSGLMPRTFWVPAALVEPRCSLEQMALDVFRHHTQGCDFFDVTTSGAEWWVQIRPSPEAGRYSMHAAVDDADPKDMTATGISFHWDKDEDLRILCGGTTYVHPHLSTVTYLTSIGAPTLALDCRVHPLTGEWIVPAETSGFLSWPLQGKHLSFDGRFLHAAPSDLMEEGMFEKQIAFAETGDKTAMSRLRWRHRRVTFLVNVWLNYHPFEVKPFPETMLSKMSGHRGNIVALKFGTTASAPLRVVIADGNDDDVECMDWPMGDCNSNESIHLKVPLSKIRSASEKGGDVILDWSNCAQGVRLQDDAQKNNNKRQKVV